MKSLLVYCTRLMPRGGIESHVLQFCEIMSDQGVAIDLVILDCKLDESDRLKMQQVCRKVYTNTIRSKLSKIIWLIKIFFLLSAKSYASVYTNGQGETIYFFGKFFQLKNKWVHHHHTSGDEVDRRTWTTRYRTVFNSANAMIACSNKNAELLSNFVGREVITIPCFSRRIVKINKKKASLKSKIIFGYYGRLIPEKGIELLCQLSEDSRLLGCEFHIWGVPTQFDELFFAQFENVKYHGAFNGCKELEGVVNYIDVFLLLSVHPEGLPISLLEVTSSGTPWIASDRGGVSDIIVDSDFTILLSSSPSYDEAVEAIISLEYKLREEQTFSSKLVELYDQKFSEGAITKQWLSALRLNLD
jgi:glycosyltransferase involved in cell wall biosynthesis